MVILNSILPAFIIIAFGYFLKKKEYISETTETFINNLAYYLVLPCMIFGSIYKLPFREVFNLAAVGGLYLSATIAFGLALGLSFLFNERKRGAFTTSSYRSNIAYIGFPIVYNLYGDLGLGKISVITGFMAPFIIIIAVIYLNYQERCCHKKENVLKLITKDPLIVTSIVAVILSYFEVKFPKFFMTTVDMFSSMGSPLMLIAVGAGLKISAINKDRIMIGVSTFIKLMVMPAVSLLIFTYVIPIKDEMMFNIAVLTLALPTALSNFVLVKKYGGDHTLVAGTITVTTIASLFTISAWTYLLMK